MSTFADLPSGVETLHEGTMVRYDWTSTEAVARFYMPWGTRKAFQRVVAGLPQQFSAGGTSYTRNVPLQFFDEDNCYAYDLEITGDGPSSLPSNGYGIQYTWAIATVKFRTPPWRIDGPTPLCQRSAETSADMVTRPGTAYKFPSDSLLLPHPVAVRIATTEFTITFFQLTDYNDTLYESLAGKVNSATFLGKSVGTVQYVGPTYQGTTYLGNTANATVTHRFRWRSVDHRIIMRPDGGGFEAPVQVSDGTTKLLSAADLNLLWAN